MGKALRVLVVIFFLLTLGALTLAILLFGKRELLKGRTQRLERAVLELGPTIEADLAAPDRPAAFEARDILPCSATPVDTPERSTFWNTYKLNLEVTDLKPVRVDHTALMTYFKVGPDGAIEKDPVTGKKIVTGAGTMDAILADVVKKSADQLARLNETRIQLKRVREELVDAIRELNSTKRQLREALGTVVQRDQRIGSLEGQISQLNQKISELEEMQRALEGQIADKDHEIAKLNDAIVQKDNNLAAQKKEIDSLRARLKEIGVSGTEEGAGERTYAGKINPGDKGEIVSVNRDWNFVVMKVSDEFLGELLGPDRANALPTLDVMLKRKDSGQFVTKVRLVQVRTDELLIIGDILTNWEQAPVQVGDVVFF